MRALITAAAIFAMASVPSHAETTCGPAEAVVSSVTSAGFAPFAQFTSTDDGGIVTIFRDTKGRVVVVGTHVAQQKACIYDGGIALKLALPEYDRKDVIIDPGKPGAPT